MKGKWFLILLVPLLVFTACGDIVLPDGIEDMRSVKAGGYIPGIFRIEGSVCGPEGEPADGIEICIDGRYFDTPQILYDKHYIPVCSVTADESGRFCTDSLRSGRDTHPNLRLLFTDPSGRYATDSLLVSNIEYRISSDSCFILQIATMALKAH